ncbi:CorA family divalent cation transporter [Agromyces sp. G08B096]|uniref:CorA family divalent cation transporter n=1 Tax=Agromyces sp. G08B096 TaxID=3156399 RepID=A0AAU7W743_9MICO
MHARVLELDRGEVTELDGDPDPSDLPPPPKGSRHGTTWYCLVDPDEEVLARLGEQLDLHPLAVEDVSVGRQQPKVQRFGAHIFVVAWDLLPGDDQRMVVGEVFFFIGSGWLVTVQHAHGQEVTDLCSVMETHGRDLGEGPVAATAVLLRDIVSRYTAAAADVETELERLEGEVFDPDTTDDVARILLVRQNIGRLERAVASLSAALEASLGHFEELALDREKLGPYLRDLIDDIAGTTVLATDQARALEAIVSSHESNVAMRQNQDMRTISAFAALLAIPTLIAGVYGMNFKNLPLVQWQWGWLVVTALIVAIDLAVYWRFKHRHWF